jgi:hypothetical protein
MTRTVDAGRKFIAGRIVNAFGFSDRLLQHFQNRGAQSVAAGLDTRAKKRFRGINIADLRYMALVEQK